MHWAAPIQDIESHQAQHMSMVYENTILRFVLLTAVHGGEKTKLEN